MQQKELAALLDISPAMVSRLAKRGMPTDTLERAERWRKRHLEPGRVKGHRYAPSDYPAPARLPSLPKVLPRVLDVEMEGAGDLIDAALARGNLYGAAIRTWQLRALLRKTTDDASPRLSLRVWLALFEYMLHHEAEIRHATDTGTLLTPAEFGVRVCLANPWPANVVLFDACDLDDDAINGWPECESDD